MNEFLKRLDLTHIYPPFLTKIDQLLLNCQKRGAQYYATSGYRSVEEQDKLYAYGRTDMSRGIVTNAKGGYSAHQYGVGIDGCKDADINKPGLQPNYDEKEYQILAEEAEKLGLEPGLRWTSIHDAPHIQLPLRKYNLSWSILLGIYHQKGLAGVWKVLDTHSW